MCQVVDAGGSCVPVPQVCPEIFQPVCGCDGKTYGNDCERRGAKVQKAHDGRCGCLPPPCLPDTLPYDADGDGCDDGCAPRCTDVCDCTARPFTEPCLALCPICGPFWVCEDGRCLERCGPVLPDDGKCPGS